MADNFTPPTLTQAGFAQCCHPELPSPSPWCEDATTKERVEESLEQHKEAHGMPRSDGKSAARGQKSPPRLDDETGAYPNPRLENGDYGSSKDTVRNAHAAMDEMAAGGVGGRRNPFDAASLD